MADTCVNEFPLTLPILPSCRRFAVIGSPNSGKSTLFNALTGMRCKTANYPGVTVECSYGIVKDNSGREVELVDLPGSYSLTALSPEEKLVFDHVIGKPKGQPSPDAILFVADCTTLSRSLPLLAAVIELGLPVIATLTMTDELEARRGQIHVSRLEEELGIPVFPIVANRGKGIPELRQALLGHEPLKLPEPRETIPRDEEAKFAWGDRVLESCYVEPSQGTPWTDAADALLLHPVAGILIFACVMIFFFQAIFAWAIPLMDGLEAATVWLSSQFTAFLPDGLVRDILVDGIITGVGSVIVFVPQIALLFLLLTILEQVGYMSRAVFVIDRVMSRFGLDGRAFVALLSSYACAVPGIMATRNIPDFRQRLATILVAPFMTCSARLPVYILLIAAFVPPVTVGGFLNLQGLVMLGLYLTGTLVALLAAKLLRRGPLRGRSIPFYIELPPYRMPTLTSLWHGLWLPVRRFLVRAGTVILAFSIILWVLLAFPRSQPPEAVAVQGGEAISAYQLEQSYAAHIGKTLEPVFSPVGFDWRINIGLVASLAAREVIVATLAQIYSAQSEDKQVLGDALRERMGPPGVTNPTPTQQLAVALAILAFFVFALQCTSTIVVMRRETGSWKYPAAAFLGMFALAYTAAFLSYRLTLWLA